jgi:hypothetical protein
MNSIYTIISLFSVAAILGMYLISFILRNKKTPLPVAFIHGFFSASSLVLLIIYAVKNNAGLIEAIVLFSIAALGGIVMIIRDLMEKSVPKPLAVAHGILAITGYVVLLVYAL